MDERLLTEIQTDARQRGDHAESENDAELAQKLGQLQPFLAVFPHESMGQLASFGPTGVLGQPDPFVAKATYPS